MSRDSVYRRNYKRMTHYRCWRLVRMPQMMVIWPACRRNTSIRQKPIPPLMTDDADAVTCPRCIAALAKEVEAELAHPLMHAPPWPIRGSYKAGVDLANTRIQGMAADFAAIDEATKRGM